MTKNIATDAKFGDKLRCIDDTGSRYTTHTGQLCFLVVGKEYKFVKYDSNFFVELVEHPAMGWLANRFEFVESTIKTEDELIDYLQLAKEVSGKM